MTGVGLDGISMHPRHFINNRLRSSPTALVRINLRRLHVPVGRIATTIALSIAILNFIRTRTCLVSCLFTPKAILLLAAPISKVCWLAAFGLGPTRPGLSALYLSALDLGPIELADG